MRALLKETFFKSKIKNKFLYLNSEKTNKLDLGEGARVCPFLKMEYKNRSLVRFQ